MTYDYHGQWDKITGHVAPMYPHPDDVDITFNAVSNDLFFRYQTPYFYHLCNYFNLYRLHKYLTSVKEVKEFSFFITVVLHSFILTVVFFGTHLREDLLLSYFFLCSTLNVVLSFVRHV
jgi:hypothetical protein